MSFISKAVRELTPAVIAYENEIPREDFERFINDVILYINGSKIFKVVYTFFIIIIVFLPFFTKGKIFYWLKPEKKEDFINKLFKSRFSLLRGAATITGTPIKMVYYNREEEMKRLGFDIKELKKEARLRVVTRDRSTSAGRCPIN